MQTLASQLSSTLMQLLFSFDRGMRVEKGLMQTLASQLSSTLMQLLFSFDQGMRVEKTLLQNLASQLSCNSCYRLTRVLEMYTKIHTKRTVFSVPKFPITFMHGQKSRSASGLTCGLKISKIQNGGSIL